jgi:6-pyruvoyltetrahydropterin/6-carboxytetrahydropterin synthase
MSIAYLTRKERFNAAHKLWVADWSEDKNIEVFGKCANKNWHGHNYTLEVTVKGTPDEMTGFIIDAKVLSDIIKVHVIEYLDHMNLNLDVPFISKSIQPTTENLVILIWKQLVDKIPDSCILYRIKLVETETISAEYYGE